MERSPQVYVKPSSGVTSNDRGWEDFRENDVPCHHLPAGMQKKIHLADKVDSRQAKEIGFMNTHLPIARRSNGDTKQAVLLTLLPRYPSSRFLSDIIGFAPHYSGGTVPAFHRSSLLSPQGTFLFIFGCHYSITLDSCCQIDFATWYETGRFRNRRGHPGLACLCTRKHHFAKRDARDVLIHALL